MHYTNLLSQIFEKFATYAFPPFLQKIINQSYVYGFDIKMDEFDTLESYPTLNALFTRSLLYPRDFDKNQTIMISPCDSLVMEFGECQDNKAMQIKGKSYCVDDFLKGTLEEGFKYLNFYLSPRDYHRFHAPLDLKVLKIRYIDGILLSVKESSLQSNDAVFTKNKRVILECEDCYQNPFYFVAIGALNVGRIQINFCPEITKHQESLPKESKEIIFKTPYLLKKGDEIGTFQMGSTIVLFFKQWDIGLKERERVYFGQQIARKEN
ncbi:MAG: phosphatidylserine decarboxylase [Helicobacter sp.]|nr:phosphatidylserine decarboxylase [Helicobacter sp.]